MLNKNSDENENEDLRSQDRTPLTVEKWLVQNAFDIAVGSMDFASGFLSDEDILALRALALVLGVDPKKGTPKEHRCKFETRHVTPPDRLGWGKDCVRCRQLIPEGSEVISCEQWEEEARAERIGP